MQQTSFKIGFQGTPFHSGTPHNATASTERLHREPTKALGVSKGSVKMQKEHFSLGSKEGEFKTVNQSYFRWIQPKGDLEVKQVIS